MVNAQLFLTPPDGLHTWEIWLSLPEKIFMFRPTLTKEEIELFDLFNDAVVDRSSPLSSYMFYQCPLDIEWNYTVEPPTARASSAMSMWEYLGVDKQNRSILDHAEEVARKLGLELVLGHP